VPLADALDVPPRGDRVDRVGWTTSGDSRLRVDQRVIDAPVPPCATVGDRMHPRARRESTDEAFAHRGAPKEISRSDPDPITISAAARALVDHRADVVGGPRCARRERVASRRGSARRRPSTDAVLADARTARSGGSS
jgi:hypothetical protein